MTYRIKTEHFEGPLDLLLSLIEEERLDITRFSLAAVADQYLEYMSSQSSITLENMAQFLAVASRLILIKSKALLPLLEFSEEEEEEIRDLEQQLAEYKKFKDIAKMLGESLAAANPSFARESFWGVKSVFYPSPDLDAAKLRDCFRSVLGELPQADKLEEEMIREVITLEERMHHLETTLRERMRASFAEIVASAQDKVEVIVSFLAMLEMVKQRVIHAEQGSIFGDIALEHRVKRDDLKEQDQNPNDAQ